MREDFDSSMEPPDDPIIVCLCGSGRFKDAFDQAEFDETVAGKIVLTIGCNTKDIARDGNFDHLKPMLDELHKRKIDLADEVLILNVGGYIGDSTRSEIEYAKQHGKTIRWLEHPAPAPTLVGLDAVKELIDAWDNPKITNVTTQMIRVKEFLAREQRLAPLREKVIEQVRIALITSITDEWLKKTTSVMRQLDEEAAK